jgi:hypothetical protein
MAKSITSEQIMAKNARLAFVQLDKPTKIGKNPEEIAKYRVTVLLDPSDADHAAIIKQVKGEGARIAKEFWEGTVPKSLELCFGNGNDLDKVYNGFEDMFYIRLSSTDLPPIVGRQKNPSTKTFLQLSPGETGFPYSGCYGNVALTLWTQDSHGRKGLNGNLCAVQFIKDGESFRGAPPADPNRTFDDYAGDEDTADVFG